MIGSGSVCILVGKVSGSGSAQRHIYFVQIDVPSPYARLLLLTVSVVKLSI